MFFSFLEEEEKLSFSKSRPMAGKDLVMERLCSPKINVNLIEFGERYNTALINYSHLEYAVGRTGDRRFKKYINKLSFI